ncbi:MAG: hypothetical protein A2X18_08790 [Bacteroidetes bacterium GWF2_40_14]|nr:MAG: hypothetical protein A2X18_08790 [Bacteroidetes bacterium GWF2_40_14]
MKKSFILDKEIRTCLSSLEIAARSKNIEICYNIQEGINLFSDLKMVATIIRNLVSNAIKFTPHGGKVEIMAIITNLNHVEISVKDTGIGMDKQLLNNLFCISESHGRSGTEGEPSTGMGLYISRDYIERLGGTIRIESEVGKGSLFIFTIPS